MNYLYLDTASTTGEWLWKARPDDPGQPHCIRVAGALYEAGADHSMDDFCWLIKPEADWPGIPDTGYERHRIENADLRLHGMPAKSVISRLTSLLGAADVLVMQNAQFHQRMLWRLYRDAGLLPPDPMPRHFCTMIGAKAAMHSAKWIALAEGYRHFTGEALALPANAIERGVAMVAAVRAVHMGILSAEQPRRVMGGVL